MYDTIRFYELYTPLYRMIHKLSRYIIKIRNLLYMVRYVSYNTDNYDSNNHTHPYINNTLSVYLTN